MTRHAQFLLLSAAACIVSVLFAPTRAAGSALSDAAAAMAPGEWRELTTTGIRAALSDSVPVGVSSILPYADKMHWDPQTNRVYFVNSDDPGDGRRFVAYDEPTNSWVTLPDPWTSTTVSHQYGLADIDVVGRRLYVAQANGESMQAYDLSTQTWGGVSMPTSQYSIAGALAYFPERNSIIYTHGPNLRERQSSGTWRNLGSINTTYHAITYYNPVHKLVIFGGGNDSSYTFYKLNQAGQVTALRTPPVALESPRVEFVADTVHGQFLVFSRGKRFFYYDPVSDVWTEQSTASVPAGIWVGSEYNTPLLMTVATPIHRYGVAFFTGCAVAGECKVHLYKFAEPPPMPNAPTNLTVN
jgi:hypothetical protein